MKRNIGCEVTIREDLEPKHRYGYCFFVDDMIKYKGKRAIITGLDEEWGFYYLGIDNQTWRWTDEMFEDESNKKNQKKELVIGDYSTDFSRILKEFNQLQEEMRKLLAEFNKVEDDNIELRKQNDKLYKILENNSNEQILKNQIHIAELINYMFNELYNGTNKTIEENWFRGKVEDIIKDTKKVLKGR